MAGPPGVKPWVNPEVYVKRVSAGLWVLVAGAILTTIGYYGLPYVIEVFKMLIAAGRLIPALVGSVIAIAAAGYMLCSPKFWLFGRTMMGSFGRWIVEIWKRTMPVQILEQCLEDMRTLAQQCEAAFRTVGGVMEEFRQLIATAVREQQEAMLAVQASRKKAAGERNAYAEQLMLNKVGRRERSKVSYRETLKALEVMHRWLLKMSEAANYIVLDKDDELKDLKRNMRAGMAFKEGVRAAFAVLKSGHARELFDSTMEMTLARLNAQVGEARSYIDLTKGIIGEIDLQQGALTEQGEQLFGQFQQWSQNLDSVLLGDKKAGVMAEAEAVVAAEFGDEPQIAQQAGRYTRLLGQGGPQ